MIQPGILRDSSIGCQRSQWVETPFTVRRPFFLEKDRSTSPLYSCRSWHENESQSDSTKSTINIVSGEVTLGPKIGTQRKRRFIHSFIPVTEPYPTVPYRTLLSKSVVVMRRIVRQTHPVPTTSERFLSFVR